MKIKRKCKYCDINIVECYFKGEIKILEEDKIDEGYYLHYCDIEKIKEKSQ